MALDSSIPVLSWSNLGDTWRADSESLSVAKIESVLADNR